MNKESVRCLYINNFIDFYEEDNNSIFGKLCNNYHGGDLTTTREAWKAEISIIKNVIAPFKNEDGQVIFEYNIPRLGKRIDVVLLFRGIVFCLEFKVGEDKIIEENIDQVFDYALDLKNFHKYSQDKIIVPILVVTRCGSSTTNVKTSIYDDKVVNPLVTGQTGLSDVIDLILNEYKNETPIDTNWIISPYAPTPTIIEAARALYENHSVEDITRNEADKVSTDRQLLIF